MHSYLQNEYSYTNLRKGIKRVVKHSKQMS